MPEKSVPQEDVTRLVRNALAHLYDTAHLQTHPLSAMFDAQHMLDSVTRAQRLRRALLDTIEALRPQPSQSAPPEAARAYAILSYRYIDGLSMDEVVGKLALSRRQVYREHEKGIEAIAALLIEQHHTALAALAESTDIAQREVSRLQQSSHAELLRLPDIVEAVTSLLVPIAKQSKTRIQMNAARGLPSIQGDRVQLRQAFIALLTHALELEPTQIRITLKAIDNNTIVAQIQSIELRKALNESPTKLSQDLEISKALIEAHGGQAQFQLGQQTWEALLSFRPHGQQRTILVIDDNTDLVELFRRYLGGHDIDVVGVTDSRQALRMANEVRPALITLDVMMPGLDGWEVLQQLRSNAKTRQIPIVICSVLKESKLALSMGANAYLSKPVQQSDFLEVTRRLLGELKPTR